MSELLADKVEREMTSLEVKSSWNQIEETLSV